MKVKVAAAFTLGHLVRLQRVEVNFIPVKSNLKLANISILFTKLSIRGGKKDSKVKKEYQNLEVINMLISILD